MSTPITVYGDVDERAVTQLRRCADAGDALRGALCADGHVGYSHPIGGAGAHRDHISPSRGGDNIPCLASAPSAAPAPTPYRPAAAPIPPAAVCWLAIEEVAAGEPVLGWDTARVRAV